ncbi:MAG: hypothetical protein CBD18_04395 [Opitutales bacterium TMED158]|nr:MAG: hypothetical protein CBD18_04395 [Opitutales bacterium TMED158]
MRAKKAVVLLSLAMGVLLSVGCIRPSAHFEEIAADVVSSNESFDTQIELRIGGFPIWVAETIAGFVDSPEAQEASEYLDGVREVEFGVYQTSRGIRRDLDGMAESIESTMRKWGFERIVKVREDESLVTVYLPRNTQDGVKEGFVVVVDRNEIVLVKAEADFEWIAREAIARHGLPLNVKEEFAANW